MQLHWTGAECLFKWRYCYR